MTPLAEGDRVVDRDTGDRGTVWDMNEEAVRVKWDLGILEWLQRRRVEKVDE